MIHSHNDYNGPSQCWYKYVLSMLINLQFQFQYLFTCPFSSNICTVLIFFLLLNSYFKILFLTSPSAPSLSCFTCPTCHYTPQASSQPAIYNLYHSSSTRGSDQPAPINLSELSRSQPPFCLWNKFWNKKITLKLVSYYLSLLAISISSSPRLRLSPSRPPSPSPCCGPSPSPSHGPSLSPCRGPSHSPCRGPSLSPRPAQRTGSSG